LNDPLPLDFPEEGAGDEVEYPNPLEVGNPVDGANPADAEPDMCEEADPCISEPADPDVLEDMAEPLDIADAINLMEPDSDTPNAEVAAEDSKAKSILPSSRFPMDGNLRFLCNTMNFGHETFSEEEDDDFLSRSRRDRLDSYPESSESMMLLSEVPHNFHGSRKSTWSINEFTYDSKAGTAHANGYVYTVGLINPLLTPVPISTNGSEGSEEHSAMPMAAERKIGPLTVSERKKRVLKYLEKRKKRRWSKKAEYMGRQKVAEKRLRVKGKFVSREQALAVLDEGNGALRSVISGSTKNAILSGSSMKIRNVNMLLCGKREERKLTQEAIFGDKKVALVAPLPPVETPVFCLTKARNREVSALHIKYHNQFTTTL